MVSKNKYALRCLFYPLSILLLGISIIYRHLSIFLILFSDVFLYIFQEFHLEQSQFEYSGLYLTAGSHEFYKAVAVIRHPKYGNDDNKNFVNMVKTHEVFSPRTIIFIIPLSRVVFQTFSYVCGHEKL